MKERILGSIKLSVDTYDQVESDMSLMKEAILLVLLSGVAGSIGVLEKVGLFPIVLGFIAWITYWMVLTLFTYVLGITLFRVQTTYVQKSQFIRVMCYAQAPGLLRIFGLIPGLGLMILILSLLWQTLASIVGVKHSLNYDSYWRAPVLLIISNIPALTMYYVLMLPIENTLFLG